MYTTYPITLLRPVRMASNGPELERMADDLLALNFIKRIIACG